MRVGSHNGFWRSIGCRFCVKIQSHFASHAFEWEIRVTDKKWHVTYLRQICADAAFGSWDTVRKGVFLARFPCFFFFMRWKCQRRKTAVWTRPQCASNAVRFFVTENHIQRQSLSRQCSLVQDHRLYQCDLLTLVCDILEDHFDLLYNLRGLSFLTCGKDCIFRSMSVSVADVFFFF